MAHIHSELNGHDSTVSAFILLREGDELKVLLHRHRKLGLWFQPGGHVELDQNPWQAIAHEIRDESGYELEDLLVLQTAAPLVALSEISHPVPLLYRSHRYIAAEPAHFHTDATYGFLAKGRPAKTPAEGESQELAWFTSDELNELTKETIHEDIRAIAQALMRKLPTLEALEASAYSLEYPEIQDQF